MTMEKTIAQAAREAADLIRKNGWIQNHGILLDANGKMAGMCMGAALNAASTVTGGYCWSADDVPAWAAPTAAVLREQYPDFEWPRTFRPDCHVVTWNDDPDRTKDEVLAILEKLAAQE
jgi:hypothetical protein